MSYSEYFPAINIESGVDDLTASKQADEEEDA